MMKRRIQYLTLAFMALCTCAVTLSNYREVPGSFLIPGDLILKERADHAQSPEAGYGYFWVKNTSPSTAIFTNDAGTDITLGSGGGGGGAVDSVNGQTGVVVLDPDDLDDTGTDHKFAAAAELSKLAGIATGATANPAYGADVAADPGAVHVDDNNWLGLGTTDPLAPLHIYSATSAPRVVMQYITTGGDPVDTGWLSAGTVVTVTSPQDAWSSPGNAAGAPDSSAASVVLGSYGMSELLRATNFSGLDIPTGATITGVETRYHYRNSNSNASEYHNQLIVGGTPTGADRRVIGDINYTATYTTMVRGEDDDLWDLELTPEDFDSSFGFEIQIEEYDSGDVTFYVDSMQIRVHYIDMINQTWSTGVDTSDGAYTITGDETDHVRVDYETGDTVFGGDVTASAFVGDGSGLTGIAAGITAPGTTTDQGIATWNGTDGGGLRNNATPTIDSSGNIIMGSGDTVDGRDLSEDGAKLDGIEVGATANTGTVTSIAISGADGIDVDLGSPVTTSGTIQLGLDSNTIHWNMMVAGSTVTAAATDYVAISDTSNSGALRKALAGDWVLAPTGTDNALMKKIGATGQLEQTGILVDDSNNMTGVGTINGRALVAPDTAQTLTYKRIVPRVGTGNPLGAYEFNVDIYDILIVPAAATSPLAIAAPTGTPTDGQKIQYNIQQEGSIPTVFSWNSVFKAGADWGGVIPTLSTTADAWDYYLFMWNEAEEEWHLLACSQGN